MPQLPSGREIAITARRLSEVAARYEDTGEPAALDHVRTVRDLYPYIDVMYFRPRTDGAPGAVDAYLPTGLEPYPSGYTLADMEAFTRDWTEADRAAFHAFLEEDRTREYLAKALDRIRLAQLARAEPTPANLLQAAVIADPQVAELFSGKADDAPLALEPGKLEAAALVAIARVAFRVHQHERLYAANGPRFERARVFVRFAFDHERKLLASILDASLAFEDATARLQAALAAEEIEESARRWIDRQLWHEVINLWPALDNEYGRRVFPQEHEALEQAWVSPAAARALDEMRRRGG